MTGGSSYFAEPQRGLGGQQFQTISSRQRTKRNGNRETYHRQSHRYKKALSDQSSSCQIKILY